MQLVVRFAEMCGFREPALASNGAASQLRAVAENRPVRETSRSRHEVLGRLQAPLATFPGAQTPASAFHVEMARYQGNALATEFAATLPAQTQAPFRQRLNRLTRGDVAQAAPVGQGVCEMRIVIGAEQFQIYLVPHAKGVTILNAGRLHDRVADIGLAQRILKERNER